MNEIQLKFSLDSPQAKNIKIVISIADEFAEGLLYKYMAGLDGRWKIIKEFSSDKSAGWVPEEDGKYIIMVQARKPGSSKPFDYISRMEYIIGNVEENPIKGVFIEKDKLKIGEKLTATVESGKTPVMYRFKIRTDKGEWQLIRDYSADNSLIWSAKYPGRYELLAECKTIDSKNDFDAYEIKAFNVERTKKIEIYEFNAVTSNLLVNNEIMFQVRASFEEGRTVLYKFIKIDSENAAMCIQNYSTRPFVSYTEKKSGSYRILCLVKDMYSANEYDDRAIISFNVKPYNSIAIRNFTTDLSSPQMRGTNVTLKADVTGGKNLLYRFMVDGNYGEDSGFIKNSSYIWKTQGPGKYKIMLFVKDNSFNGNYEASSEIEFTLTDVNRFPVKINEIILDKEKRLLINEAVNFKIIASGGIDLRYSFIVRKESKVIEKIDYGTCNFASFTPIESGNYEMEAMVKDKFSQRQFDSHAVVFFEALDYFPANIDYVLYPLSDYHMVGDTFTVDIIAQNTKNVLVKYNLEIDDHMVEKTDFTYNKKYSFTPRSSGVYNLKFFAKNKFSKTEFDCIREAKIVIHDTLPITNTKIQCDKAKICCNDPAIFSVASQGGREVLYEFYLMENEEWKQVQKYSRKDNYSFIPFLKGKYKILVLCKSQYNKCFYEDYDLLEFIVE